VEYDIENESTIIVIAVSSDFLKFRIDLKTCLRFGTWNFNQPTCHRFPLSRTRQVFDLPSRRAPHRSRLLVWSTAFRRVFSLDEAFSVEFEKPA